MPPSSPRKPFPLRGKFFCPKFGANFWAIWQIWGDYRGEYSRLVQVRLHARQNPFRREIRVFAGPCGGEFRGRFSAGKKRRRNDRQKERAAPAHTWQIAGQQRTRGAGRARHLTGSRRKAGQQPDRQHRAAYARTIASPEKPSIATHTPGQKQHAPAIAPAHICTSSTHAPRPYRAHRAIQCANAGNLPHACTIQTRQHTEQRPPAHNNTRPRGQ